MNGPLVVVFLAVIALTALLQAAFVGALAFGLRLGRRKMREAEEKLVYLLAFPSKDRLPLFFFSEQSVLRSSKSG